MGTASFRHSLQNRSVFQSKIGEKELQSRSSTHFQTYLLRSALTIEIPFRSPHNGQVSFETSGSSVQEDLLFGCCSVVLPLAVVSLSAP